MSAARVHLAGRDLEVIAEADVVVAGSGPGGLGAALAAARAGASVVLCERHGFMGGNFTAAAVGSVCGYYANVGTIEAPSFEPVVGGIAEEILSALAAEGHGMGPIPFKEQTAVFLYQPWAAKRLFDHLVIDEERIDLLLHTVVADALVHDGAMRALVVATKGGLRAVVGKVFVDATGDADVSTYAGVPTEAGGPGSRQFASMQFLLEQVDDAAVITANAALPQLISEFGDHLSRDGGAVVPTFHPGEFLGAMTRVRNPDGSPVDTTDPRQATWGELEGRRLAEEAAAFLRERVPGFERSFLADTAVQLGVRETRHVRGEYTLTGADVRTGARFADAIAACAWPQEYHVRGRSTSYEFLPPGVTYQVPFASLRPEGVANLLVAGRCISADHDALASVRVMAPCLAMGQAAGTAAALACREAPGADTPGRPGEIDVGELQDALFDAGARLG
jgi:glycine/D-amino acid oxidase-like deaminating enzyme